MGFLDFLNGFLQGASGVGAQIQAVFAFLVFYINALFSFLYKVLVDVANFLYDILKRVGKFFRYVWDKFFYGIFNRLFQKLLIFHDWLEAHLKPIIQFLQKVRAYIDRFFKLYIKPFLNLIQHIRRVLLIMRLLHIKFAQQLDSRLLRLEVKVAGVFIQARAVLNNIIDVVNILADPTRLLRHPTLVISIRRSLPAIFRSFTGIPIGFFLPSHSPDAPKDEQDVYQCANIQDIIDTIEIGLPIGLGGIGAQNFLEDPTALTDNENSPPLTPLGYFTSGEEDVLKCLGILDEATAAIHLIATDADLLRGEFAPYANEARTLFIELVGRAA